MVRQLLKDIVLRPISSLVPLTAVRDRYPQFRPYPYDAAYETWMRTVEPTTFVDPIGPIANPFGDGPMFSIVVPAFNTPQRYLEPLVDSLLAQTFGDFELLLADASTDPDAARRVAAVSERDPRIRYIRLDENGGISRNTNAGIDAATGSFVVFVDHDDTLAPQALNEVAAYLLENPATEIVYTDEDKITDDGRWRHSPHRKPAWSPHQYLCCNYTSHLSVVRRSLLEEEGGLDPDCDGAQDFELILRLTSTPRVVGHIPKVLYHWRTAPGSTADVFEVKPYVREAGRSAVERSLSARGIDCTVIALENKPGWYEARPRVHGGPRVVVVAIGSGAADPDELIASTDTAQFGEVRTHRTTDDDITDVVSDLAAHDFVVVVRESVRPRDPQWLSRLVGVANMPDTASVAPRLVDEDDIVVDMGVVGVATGEPTPLFVGYRADSGDERGDPGWARDVDRLSGAFVVARRDRFDRDPEPGEHHVVWSPVTMVVDRPAPPRVSVCVPLYKHADTVERCLRSILEQDHDDYEIVVVDDASGDCGAEIARRLLRPTDRVVVNQTRLGAAENHNRCIEHARGDLVQFVHGDDELLPGALQVLSKPFDDPEVALTFSRRRLVTDDDEFRDFAATVHHNFTDLREVNDADELVTDIAWKGLWRNWFGEPTNVMFRRVRALAAGGFRDDLAQVFDIDMWVHLIAGGRVVFVDEEYSVRHHDGDTLSSANRKADRDWLDHTRMLWGVAMDPELPPRARLYAGLWLTTCHPTSVLDAVRSPAGTRLGRLADVAVLPFSEIERRQRISARRSSRESTGVI